jgi:outer membrane immunogenic protein
MLRALLSVAVTVAGLTAAQAADTYSFSPSPMAYNWTGFHIGAVAGLAGGDFENDVPTTPGPTGEGGGFTAGVVVGYTHQFSPNWAVGIEGDISYIDIEGSSVNGSFEERWMGTLRARAGYTWSRYFAYATAGVAMTQIDVARAGGSTDETVAGFTVGAGLEGHLTGNWSARIEYLFVDVPEKTFTFTGGPVVGGSNNHVGRVGVSYRF